MDLNPWKVFEISIFPGTSNKKEKKLLITSLIFKFRHFLRESSPSSEFNIAFNFSVPIYLNLPLS